MTGIWLFFAMIGSASASSRLGTATRTMSQPDAVSSAICCSVALMFGVGVVVIDCTLTWASPPTRTLPTLIWRDLRRGARTSGTLGIPRFTAGTVRVYFRAACLAAAGDDARSRARVARQRRRRRTRRPDDGAGSDSTQPVSTTGARRSPGRAVGGGHEIDDDPIRDRRSVVPGDDLSAGVRELADALAGRSEPGVAADVRRTTRPHDPAVGGRQHDAAPPPQPSQPRTTAPASARARRDPTVDVPLARSG